LFQSVPYPSARRECQRRPRWPTIRCVFAWRAERARSWSLAPTSLLVVPERRHRQCAVQWRSDAGERWAKVAQTINACWTELCCLDQGVSRSHFRTTAKALRKDSRLDDSEDADWLERLITAKVRRNARNRFAPRFGGARVSRQSSRDSARGSDRRKLRRLRFASAFVPQVTGII